jgi:hypothetical protein
VSEHPDVSRRALQAVKREERDLLAAVASEMDRPVTPPDAQAVAQELVEPRRRRLGIKWR